MKAAEMFNLAGRVALVTGASSGLGQQFARALADNGASVALVARRADRLLDLQQEIEAAGGKAMAIEADVTKRDDMVRAFDAAEKAFGTVTILVNNAGIAHGGRATELTPEDWRRMMSTNLDAVFYWAQEAARRLLAAGKQGAIVNIASVLGLMVAKGGASYATAKAGVIQVTKALAVELAFKGVRVNAIAPGWFVTEINDDYLLSEKGDAIKRDIPMGRFGKSGDLDGALLLVGVGCRQLYHRRRPSWPMAGRWCRLKGKGKQPWTSHSHPKSKSSGSRFVPLSTSKCCRSKMIRPISPTMRTFRTTGSSRAGQGARRGPVGAAKPEGIWRHGIADGRLGGDL